MITTPDVSVPEKTEKVITLKSNKGKGVSFSIVNDTDKDITGRFTFFMPGLGSHFGIIGFR
jgi:hypothetical protein